MILKVFQVALMGSAMRALQEECMLWVSEQMGGISFLRVA